MRDLDLADRLRDVLHDSQFAHDGWTDPVTRVGRGIRRRRRRRAGVACALATAIVTAPLVLWPQRTPGVDWPVAFADVPAARPVMLAARDPLPAARPCSAGELDTRAIVVGGTVLLRNRGKSPCTLADESVVVATNRASGTRDTFASQAEPVGAFDFPATVVPGDTARIDLTAGSGCGDHFDDLVLVVQGRDYPLPLETDCPPTVSRWYVHPETVDGPLKVKLQVPESVQPGQTFEFLVLIANTLPAPFRFFNCPVYLQRIGTQAVWRRLNCAAVREIPRDASVRFTMRATAPVHGDLTLSWMAVLPDGSVATASPVTLPAAS